MTVRAVKKWWFQCTHHTAVDATEGRGATFLYLGVLNLGIVTGAFFCVLLPMSNLLEAFWVRRAETTASLGIGVAPTVERRFFFFFFP